MSKNIFVKLFFLECEYLHTRYVCETIYHVDLEDSILLLLSLSEECHHDNLECFWEYGWKQ